MTNIILDYTLFVLFNLGIQGAAIATGLVYSITSVLAFSRSLFFTVASIQLMPVLLGGVTGVWLAALVAELLGTIMVETLLL